MIEMYQALYRKYRPKRFEEVFGQDAIVKTLKNALQTGQITHAYMFSGPRGTGKTTVAKIFARAINCTSIEKGEACGHCSNCNISFSNNCIDIIEIDAASNNGVDEIRELKNKVNIVPSELKYKIYIIDEVHMLSIGAFNALLKTLEEPPEHVIFILATTDPQKVPVTIISRCQCFQFKRITEESMIQRLKQISKLENFEIEEDVYRAIANASGGGLRDAIGLLDKITSYKDNLVTIEDFYQIQGSLVEDDLEKLTTSIFSNQPKLFLKLINDFVESGKDLVQIAKQLLIFLKNKLVLYYTENKKMQYDEDTVILLINKLNKRLFDIKKVDDSKTYVEVFFLSFMHDSLKQKKPMLDEKKEEPKNITVEIKNDNIPSSVPTVDDKEEISLQIKEMKNSAHHVLSSASKIELNQVKENWKKLDDFTFDSHIGYVVCYLMDGTLCAADKETIILSYEYDSMIEKILPSLEKMEKVFSQITNLKKKILLISNDTWKNLKQEFIRCKQAGIPFEKKDSKKSETEMISKESPKQDLKQQEIEENDNILALFGDIVEIK